MSVFLLGSGPGVWVQRARALHGRQPGDIQRRPHTVPAAEAPPVLLPPVSAEVGKQRARVGPPDFFFFSPRGVFFLCLFSLQFPLLARKAGQKIQESKK